MVEEYITSGEAQEILNVSRQKMAKLLAEKALPYEVDALNKRKKLVKRSDVERLKKRSAELGARGRAA